jgi:hypothetical protein
MVGVELFTQFCAYSEFILFNTNYIVVKISFLESIKLIVSNCNSEPIFESNPLFIVSIKALSVLFVQKA